MADIPPPLDEDGVRTVATGTALFGVAAAITPFVASAEVAWTCLAGFGLGLFGVYYCVRRRTAIARDRAAGTAIARDRAAGTAGITTARD